MSYHDNNYLLQDALAAYLAANLSTYAGGVAAALPIVTGGDFGDRGSDHIYVVTPELQELDGVAYGNFTGSSIVGVGTLKETPIATHRAYSKAVIDLMMDAGVALHMNTSAVNALRINQRLPGIRTRIGTISEGMRFTEIEVGFMVYQTA